MRVRICLADSLGSDADSRTQVSRRVGRDARMITAKAESLTVRVDWSIQHLDRTTSSTAYALKHESAEDHIR